MKPYSFFKLWILGFVGLLIFDLFIEGVVFEWLKLNGTTKNDWFFKVWWVAVVIWFKQSIKKPKIEILHFHQLSIHQTCNS